MPIIREEELSSRLEAAIPVEHGPIPMESILRDGRRSMVRRRLTGAAAMVVVTVAVGGTAIGVISDEGVRAQGREAETTSRFATGGTAGPFATPSRSPCAGPECDGVALPRPGGAAFVDGRLVVHPEALVLDRLDLTTSSGGMAVALAVRADEETSWLLVIEENPGMYVTEPGGDPDSTLSEWAQAALSRSIGARDDG